MTYSRKGFEVLGKRIKHWKKEKMPVRGEVETELDDVGMRGTPREAGSSPTSRVRGGLAVTSWWLVQMLCGHFQDSLYLVNLLYD